tara:strand:- start:1199 stop:2221 length:1023 start_codon:yes stop_codon:yes gene_type:complete
MLDKIILSDVSNIINNCKFSKLKNSSILITGASGLIGTYILACLELLNTQDYNIKVFLQHYSKLPIHLDRYNRLSNFKSLKFDITDPKNFKDIPKCDYIIHGSGYAQPSLFMKDQIKTLKINTSSTLNLIEKLNTSGIFLFLSSSDVYRGCNKKIYSETDVGSDMSEHPRYSYIEGKKIGELLIKCFKNHNLNIKIARISSAFGPGTKKDDTRVINSFIKKALIEKKITLLDQGEAIHTYCYISDTVEMLFNIMLNGKDTTYNIAGKSITSIRNLAKLIGNITNTPIEIPDKNNDIIGSPLNVKLDMEKYIKEFNKQFFFDLEQGLKNTIQWQKKLYFSK